MENGSHFAENCHTAKFQITDPLKSLVSAAFLSEAEMEIGVSHYEKMALISWKIVIQQSFKLLTPQDWVSTFLSVDGNRKLGFDHYEKMEKGLPFYGKLSYSKISTNPPPKLYEKMENFQSRKLINLEC